MNPLIAPAAPPEEETRIDVPVLPPTRARRVPRPKPFASRWNALMRLFRRIHLYSGLFMFPWVMLYGTTAYLFNHPRAFTTSPAREFAADSVAGTSLATLPAPRDLAAQVVAAIEAQERQKGRDTTLELTPDSARYGRGQASISVRSGEDRHTVSLNLRNGTGTVRTRAAAPPPVSPPPPPFANRNIRIEDSVSGRLREGVPSLLEKLEVSAEDVVSVTVPDLVFNVTSGDKHYLVSYNADRGTLSTRDTDVVRDPIPTRNFLTRLHTAHGYPDEITPRWTWAVAVDAMFLSMCFWGLSGILMWWQIKSTRWWGAGFLAASVAVAATMVVGMHGDMMSAVPQGRGEAAPAARAAMPESAPASESSEASSQP